MQSTTYQGLRYSGGLHGYAQWPYQMAKLPSKHRQQHSWKVSSLKPQIDTLKTSIVSGIFTASTIEPSTKCGIKGQWNIPMSTLASMSIPYPMKSVYYFYRFSWQQENNFPVYLQAKPTIHWSQSVQACSKTMAEEKLQSQSSDTNSTTTPCTVCSEKPR